jgi:hypothetical protein
MRSQPETTVSNACVERCVVGALSPSPPRPRARWRTVTVHTNDAPAQTDVSSPSMMFHAGRLPRGRGFRHQQGRGHERAASLPRGPAFVFPSFVGLYRACSAAAKTSCAAGGLPPSPLRCNISAFASRVQHPSSAAVTGLFASCAYSPLSPPLSSPLSAKQLL